MINPTMNLISAVHHECKRKEHYVTILLEYLIITREEKCQIPKWTHEHYYIYLSLKQRTMHVAFPKCRQYYLADFQSKTTNYFLSILTHTV